MFAGRVYTLDSIGDIYSVSCAKSDYTATANTPGTASFTIRNQASAFGLRATGASAAVWGSCPSGVAHFGDNDDKSGVVERGWAEAEGQC